MNVSATLSSNHFLKFAKIQYSTTFQPQINEYWTAFLYFFFLLSRVLLNKALEHFKAINETDSPGSLKSTWKHQLFILCPPYPFNIPVSIKQNLSHTALTLSVASLCTHSFFYSECSVLIFQRLNQISQESFLDIMFTLS